MQKPVYQEHIPLSEHSNYRIGGKARHFTHATTSEEIIGAVMHALQAEKPLFVLGGGTNILFSDAGTDAYVIKIGNAEIVREAGNIIRAGAGVLMSDLLALVAAEGLAGLEWAGGLPGTLGGAVRGNAGAFGGEIKDVVREVVSLDIDAEPPMVRVRSNAECAFHYRTSIFRKRAGKEIVLEARLQLRPGDPEAIRAVMEEKIAYRKERHPIEHPNIGSIFKNIPFETFPEAHRSSVTHVVKPDPFPVVPVAFLIAEAGLKGRGQGGAMISPKHPNFIVNQGLTATAEDVKALITIVKNAIRDRYGIEIEEEIEYH